ncbi:phosphate ABC transporter ATP-binding protein PstB [Hymenobacter canadensis]|uniref:Phosphate ABC transporter ATP-binding protein PstB n=1 Tax=Hymenobacter canadensis TaxID=2999067 RepID=A0ABY7LV49_9BACT|nr:phosphate ABC transporter ATP-binding protein PstB [Hymenobacter canadensis]WBA43916.1 phosphate ABC transporter ATP-binding protein PstB [Hymenobacter canadensis]
MPELEARHATVYYGTNRVLEDVSLTVAEHTVTAFIGPSGCGKSTFLRLFNRMNDFLPDFRLEGEIRLHDQNIYAPHTDVEELRKQVGMVFQQPNPFPKSVYDNVTYGLVLQGQRAKAVLDAAVEKALRQAALWDEVKDHLRKSALALSGGQQQRLCIARALAISPHTLLMDEPASALDPIATAKIEELVQELKQDYTILIVTHNMQQARRVSDKTAFFNFGRLIEYGDTPALFEQPQQEQTQHYLRGHFG